MAVPAEKVLAAASGSTGGLGKIGTLAATSGIAYVCASTGSMNARRAYWRVQGDKTHTVTFYRARTRVDAPTLTLASVGDTETLVVNGLTYVGESTANTATYDAFEYSVAGDDTADAAALAALINADYSVVTAGTSVAATDKLTFVTDEGTKVITAAAAANYPAGQYALNATAATELASIVLAINHKHNVTCATAVAGNSFTLNVNGLDYTFTGKTGAAAAATRQFSVDTGNNETAASIVTVVNDATYGVPGITAVAASAVVSFTRNSQAYVINSISSSSGTTLAVQQAGGVPGVIAAATPGTATKAELSITPTWTNVLTLTESGDRLTVADIDCPGVKAASALGVVTLTPGTVVGTSGDMASVIYAVTGTAAGHCVVSQAATLLGLTKDYNTAAVADVAANNTTAGTLYLQNYIEGWPYLYCAISNTTGEVGTYVVGCTLV